MDRAFVTGGSGFVGRALIRRLRARGVAVRALARSDAAAKAVEILGAEPARGDLSSPIEPQLLAGCDVVFHAAASVEDWGPLERSWEVNVEGTTRILAAAQAAGVPRLVHVSTEAVLIGLGARPIVDADESWPLPARPLGVYPITKGEAERRVLAAHRAGFATVVVRPRFIWGEDDTTLLPRLIEATRRGDLVWIGGGHNVISTCHVANCVEGMLLAAERGLAGGVYFLTDGNPVEFRTFVTALLATQGQAAPSRSVPYWLAHAFAILGDWSFRHVLRGRPALPHATFHLLADTVTVDDTRARRELGYREVVSREDGLAALRAAAGGHAS